MNQLDNTIDGNIRVQFCSDGVNLNVFINCLLKVTFKDKFKRPCLGEYFSVIFDFEIFSDLQKSCKNSTENS